VWPVNIIDDLAFLETANGQIWPYYFFGPGNPVIQSRVNNNYPRDPKIVAVAER